MSDVTSQYRIVHKDSSTSAADSLREAMKRCLTGDHVQVWWDGAWRRYYGKPHFGSLPKHKE
jgi:hypothetical protein